MVFYLSSGPVYSRKIRLLRHCCRLSIQIKLSACQLVWLCSYIVSRKKNLQPIVVMEGEVKDHCFCITVFEYIIFMAPLFHFRFTISNILGFAQFNLLQVIVHFINFMVSLI